MQSNFSASGGLLSLSILLDLFSFTVDSGYDLHSLICAADKVILKPFVKLDKVG